MREKPIILIINDNKNSREICRICLEAENYMVYHTDNSVQGLKTIEHIMPDLILLDVIMSGKSGYRLLESIKANPAIKDIPVLVLTVTTDINDVVMAFQKGANDFLRKPFNVDEFLARVNALVRHKQTHDTMKQFAEILSEQQNSFKYELIKWTQEARAFQQQYDKCLLNFSDNSRNSGNLKNMLNATKQANHLISRILSFSQTKSHEQVSVV